MFFHAAILDPPTQSHPPTHTLTGTSSGELPIMAANYPAASTYGAVDDTVSGAPTMQGNNGRPSTSSPPCLVQSAGTSTTTTPTHIPA